MQKDLQFKIHPHKLQDHTSKAFVVVKIYKKGTQVTIIYICSEVDLLNCSFSCKRSKR